MLFRLPRRITRGLTLWEVIVSLALLGICAFALINGYVQSNVEAEATSYHFAAQCQALERLEQVRAAKWEPNAVPLVDQVQATNFPPMGELLQVAAGKSVYATNYTTITEVSTAPPLRLIRVDCVWPWIRGRTFTNTVFTYRGPDQ